MGNGTQPLHLLVPGVGAAGSSMVVSFLLLRLLVTSVTSEVTSLECVLAGKDVPWHLKYEELALGRQRGRSSRPGRVEPCR